MDSIRSIESNEPSVSSTSHLLPSENSWLRYTSEGIQRPVTPTGSLIRQKWYYTLLSTFHEYWENTCELCTGLWCVFLGGKFEAILRCICLPCCVLMRALNGRRRHFTPQKGIVYLYVYLCVSFVVNIAVALNKIRKSMFEDLQKWFVISTTFVAIILLLYLFVSKCQTIMFSCSRGTLLRIFYLGGTFIFGLPSFGFSVAVLLDYITCGQVLYAILMVMKAMFIVLQILFLLYFYEASILGLRDSPYIHAIMAHLLGTNLALWLWTLCSEEAGESLKDCLHYPIDVAVAEKYFEPLFVEYSLLAASLLYQIWKNVSPPRDTISALPQSRHCRTCYCNVVIPDSAMPQGCSQSDTNSNNAGSTTTEATSDQANSASESALGLFIGGCFAVLFVVLVLASTQSGFHHQRYHIAYTIGTFLLNFTQVCACYIIQLSLQSHERNPERFSLDHEDILLYISLVGTLLWESFHAYSLFSVPGIFDMVKDALAILQELFQVTTLVNLRRHKRTQNQRDWICGCVLFLLLTNLVLWVQDSFFIEVDITTPGERYVKMQHYLAPIGFVIHPLSIFFRFHSAVCCILAWSIFRTGS